MKDNESIENITFNSVRCLDTKSLLDNDIFYLVERNRKGVVLEELECKFPYLYEQLSKTEVDKMCFSQCLCELTMPL